MYLNRTSDGYHRKHQLTVPVGRATQLNMLCLVKRGVFPQSGTMTLEI